MQQEKITVNYEGKPAYDIIFGKDFSGLKDALISLGIQKRRFMIITDSNVGKLYLDDCIKNYSEEALREAMVEAIRHNKYSLSYVEGILKNKFQKSREKEGIKGGDAISSYEEELRRRGCILDLDDL